MDSTAPVSLSQKYNLSYKGDVKYCLKAFNHLTQAIL